MAANSETDAPDSLDWPAEAACHGRNKAFREGRFRALVTGGLVRIHCGPATEFCLRAPGLPVVSEGASRMLKSVAIALGGGISAGIDLRVVPPAHLAGWLQALAALAHAAPAATTGRDRAQVVGSVPACYPGLDRILGPRPDEPSNFAIAVTCSRLWRPAYLQQPLLQASYLGLRRCPVNCSPRAGMPSAGASSACLPQSRFCASTGEAWLALELDVARLGDSAAMRRQICDCVNFADGLTTSRSWGVPTLVTDALLNRRVAWLLTGIARKVMQEGYDPDDFATLCVLRRWLYAVRRCIVHESSRLDRPGFLSRNRPPANRLARAAAGLRRTAVVAGSHILVASPDALLPDTVSSGQHIDGAWLNLFPVLACMDALAAPGPLSRRLSYASWCRMVSLSRSFAPG